jgi:aminoglycoside phosphotransferase (APT) family kinase protein
MGAGPARDDAALVAGFDRWLSAHDGPLSGAHVAALRRPSSGWTNETVMFDLAGAADGERSVVVRLPALVASFPDQQIDLEPAVMRALGTAAVPVPGVVAVEHDASLLGAPFAVIECVAGNVVGDLPAFDAWLLELGDDTQRAVHEQFIRALATVHTVDAKPIARDARLRAGIEAELEYWQHYVDWAADGSPTARLADALEWCRSAPHPANGQEAASLLWGDARLGNVIWRDDARVAALIDWEGASVGPPEMDLGWYLALDALATHFVQRTVPGFLDRDGVIDCYERALGRPVEHLEWHEVFALVRSIAINECQARLAAKSRTPYPGVAGDENPVLDYVWNRINRLSATP